jgi:hypothetical protein
MQASSAPCLLDRTRLLTIPDLVADPERPAAIALDRPDRRRHRHLGARTGRKGRPGARPRAMVRRMGAGCAGRTARAAADDRPPRQGAGVRSCRDPERRLGSPLARRGCRRPAPPVLCRHDAGAVDPDRADRRPRMPLSALAMRCLPAASPPTPPPCRGPACAMCRPTRSWWTCPSPGACGQVIPRWPPSPPRALATSSI